MKIKIGELLHSLRVSYTIIKLGHFFLHCSKLWRQVTLI